MQEAQSSLLAKDDDLMLLRQELQHLKAQHSTSAQSHMHGTLHRQDAEARTQHGQDAEARTQHGQGAEARTQHRQDAEAGRAEGPSGTAESAQGRAAGQSGLPSPSLPATPHSPGGSPKGDKVLLVRSHDKAHLCEPELLYRNSKTPFLKIHWNMLH